MASQLYSLSLDAANLFSLLVGLLKSTFTLLTFTRILRLDSHCSSDQFTYHCTHTHAYLCLTRSVPGGVMITFADWFSSGQLVPWLDSVPPWTIDSAYLSRSCRPRIGLHYTAACCLVMLWILISFLHLKDALSSACLRVTFDGVDSLRFEVCNMHHTDHLSLSIVPCHVTLSVVTWCGIGTLRVTRFCVC